MAFKIKSFFQRNINTGGGNFIGGDITYQCSSFESIINSIKPISEYVSSNKMHFLCRGLGFYGRNDEINWLNEFCNQKDKVLYTVVCGIGGIGKSKLLYEYVKGNHDPKWQMCFLTEAIMETILCYDNYSYPKNLLLVIDYAARYSESLGKWIAKILGLRETKNKIRIVMIERQGLQYNSLFDMSCPWLEKFYGNSHQKRNLKMLEYSFMELKQINSDFLSNLIDDYARISMPEKKLTKEDKKTIINFISSGLHLELEKQSPLIILLIADAFLNDKPFHKWNLELLIQNYLEKLFDYWRTALCNDDRNIYNSLINILVFATVSGGLNINEDIPDCLFKDIKNVSNGGNAKIIFENATGFVNEIIAPIEPDYIGEFIVLSQLKKIVSKKARHEFVSCCYGNTEFPFFVEKCIGDYYHSDIFHSIFNEFVEILKPLNEIPNYIEQYATLLEKYARVCENSKICICTDVLKQLYEKKSFEPLFREKLAIIFSQHLYNMTVLKGYDYWTGVKENTEIQSYMRNANKSISIFKELYENYKKNHQIVLLYARGLANYAFYSYENANLAKIELANIYQNYYLQIPEISVSYSMALNNFLMRTSNNDLFSSFEDAEDAINDLSKLYNRHVVEANVQNDVSVVFVNALSNDELHEEVNQKIKELFNKVRVFQKEVIIEYAKGLNNIIAIYIKAGNGCYSKEAKKIIHTHFMTLKRMYKTYGKELLEIEIEFAKASANIIISCEIFDAKKILCDLKEICKNNENETIYKVMIIRYIKAVYHYCCLNSIHQHYDNEIDDVLTEVVLIYEQYRDISEEVYFLVEGCLYYILYLLLINKAEKEKITYTYSLVYDIYEDTPLSTKENVKTYVDLVEDMLNRLKSDRK